MACSRTLIYSLLILLAVLAPGLGYVSNASPARVQPDRDAKHNKQKLQNDGERVFQQNCARCHADPEGFSTRISGVITRHMRVRASLSRRDEDALLRFFNP